MEKFRNLARKINKSLDSLMDKIGISIRAKLVTIFLIVNIVPLIILLVIISNQVNSLGANIQERTDHLTEDTTTAIINAGDLAVTDSTHALIANAVEQIERITTDTASSIADFLYERDNDITTLANIEPTEANYRSFIETKNGRLTEQGLWGLTENGMAWERTDRPEGSTRENVSTNTENEDVVNGAGFNYRPADIRTFEDVPLFDEVTFIDTNLVEQFKITTDNSRKIHYPIDPEPKDISDRSNTYIAAEDYGDYLLGLEPGEIYVSDVIGAYVTSHYIGMYTPKQMVISAVNAEITALSGMDQMTDEIRSLMGELTIVKNEKIPAISTTGNTANEDACAALMKEVSDEALSLVDKATSSLSTQDLIDRIDNLKNKISGLVFNPYQEAFAGMENPLGVRFEGIVRWATPVVRNDRIIGYASFALNHDHIMSFTDHVTPMNERFTELSNAFDGNYAFIWDYQCRSIAHPRHHSIVGFDSDTGIEQIPWLETSIYENLLSATGGEDISDLQEQWPRIIGGYRVTSDSHPGVEEMIPGIEVFDEQSRSKRPEPKLTASGLVGLDGRYLNNAPQCTGWMDLTAEGGSGSFYILWSGLYKLTTAAAIPYYTGQYAPSEENDFSKRGFAMVTIGAGLEDFQRPAEETAEKLEGVIEQTRGDILLSAEGTQEEITQNRDTTTRQLILATVVIIILVILIAIWMASFVADNINVLVHGLTRFRKGERNYRFLTQRKDEFGELAENFDDMANSIENSVNAPFSIVDSDLNIIYMNSEGLEAIDNTFEAIRGKSYKIHSIYPFESKYCPITALMDGKEAKVYYNARNDKYYQGRAQYLLDKNNDRIGYTITSIDMTDSSLNRIQLEQAVDEANRANEHKGEFLARMSHEIRTPMNAIIGVTNIVEKKLGEYAETTPKLHIIKEHISQIENSSQHLLGLLNDILDLSKIEAGKIDVQQENTNLSKLINTVIDIISPRCEGKNIEFVTDIDDSISGVMYVTDSLRLRQVLINLLGNAVKFTAELGRVRFEVKKVEGNDQAAKFRFTVADNGIGINETSLAYIFEAFEQGDGSITRQFGGTGLGLPISRSIVRLMGGDIEVTSVMGEGSAFAFELEMAFAGFESDDDNTKHLEDVDFSGKTILIVDDVDINRMIASSLLEDTNAIIIEACDGQDALNVFMESEVGAIDAILMDVMMPIMNGMESTEAIRALDRADAKTVPIVALTANAFKEDADKAHNAGMNAHLSKPIDPDALISLLYGYLIS